MYYDFKDDIIQISNRVAGDQGSGPRKPKTWIFERFKDLIPSLLLGSTCNTL